MFGLLLKAAWLFPAMIVGAYAGATICGGGISHGPEERTWWLVQGAVAGGVVGAVAWFFYERQPSVPGH